jgi:hypothetical protein
MKKAEEYMRKYRDILKQDFPDKKILVFPSQAKLELLRVSKDTKDGLEE